VSEKNVELVRSGYADPRGLLVAIRDRVTPDTVFDFSRVYPDAPLLRGFEAVRWFREEGPWGEMVFEPERFYDVDDERVLVFVRVTAQGRSSGVAVEQRTAHEVTIRDEMVVRLRVYLDRDEALAAAGIAE
jgi:ketosteroid isomerase-like protein